MCETDQPRRMLFVDDEPHVLRGLQFSLRRFRREWEMTFEEVPERAMQLIEERPFDVVVSDMKMPRIDGVRILEKVRECHPGAVRIVLSGFTELEVAMRAVRVAHQFLTKPCDGTHLREMIQRACAVQALVTAEDVRGVVGRMTHLPSAPQVFGEVSTLLADPKATANDVAQVIERDPAICAKLLQLSNGGFFRLARPISRVEDAVSYLGFSMVKNLVLSTEVFCKSFDRKVKRSALKSLHEHSRLSAHIALQIAPDKHTRDDAFLASVLHEIGKLILASEKRDYLSVVRKLMQTQKIDEVEAERQAFGISHPEVGAYLLGLWGVPFNVVEAVALHHREISGERTCLPLDASTNVQLADALADEVRGDASSRSGRRPVEEIATRLGFSDRLEELRRGAEKASRLAATG